MPSPDVKHHWQTLGSFRIINVLNPKTHALEPRLKADAFCRDPQCGAIRIMDGQIYGIIYRHDVLDGLNPLTSCLNPTAKILPLI